MGDYPELEISKQRAATGLVVYCGVWGGRAFVDVARPPLKTAVTASSQGEMKYSNADGKLHAQNFVKSLSVFHYVAMLFPLKS